MQGKSDNKKGRVIAYLKVGLVEAVEKIAVFPERETGVVCHVNCECWRSLKFRRLNFFKLLNNSGGLQKYPNKSKLVVKKHECNLSLQTSL